MRQTVGIHQAPEMQRRIRSWLQGGSHPQPVLWLKFGERKGDTCKDSSPEGNDGTRYGATWLTGWIDNALSFDGIDNYVNCGKDASLNITEAITLETWIKIPPTLTGDGYIMCKRDGNTIQYGVWINYTNNKITLNGSGATGVEADNALVGNVWTHIICVITDSTGKIYLNGVLNKSGSVDALSSQLAVRVILGARWNVYPATARFLDGELDEIRIYDVALTAREIYRAYRGVF